MSTSIRCCKVLILAAVLHFSQAAREHEHSQAVGRSVAPQTLQQVDQPISAQDELLSRAGHRGSPLPGALYAYLSNVLQAWRTFCSANDCSQSAAPPVTAYLISLPEDSAKRQHLEQTLDEVSGLGLSVEVISAIPSDQVALCLFTSDFLQAQS